MGKLTKRQRSLIVGCLLLFGLLGTVRVSSALDVGDKALDFTLPSTSGADHQSPTSPAMCTSPGAKPRSERRVSDVR
jgi:hypothetical protein